jgi:rhodanese-related sulfurtransferase
MPKIIGRDIVQNLLMANAQLIDVLPAKEFNQSHLPGAVNVPLAQLTRATLERLNLKPDWPLIVYCYEYQ